MLENNREEEILKKHLTKEMDSIKVPKGLKEDLWIQVKPVRKNKRIILPYIATLACLTVLVALGLSGFPFNSEPTPSDTQDKNIQSIEAVLNNNLTGPDDELKQILEGEGELEALGQYERNLYKEYFADDTSYQEYISSYGSVLWVEPIRNDYKLEVKNIKYEKTDSKEIIYNFSIELQYQKKGSESSEVATLNGQANLNEEHKIEDMLIRVEDFMRSLSD